MTPRQALLKTLRRSNWSYAPEESGMWLRKGDYFLKGDYNQWELYYKIGEDLIYVTSEVYGRRQSQYIARAIDKHQRTVRIIEKNRKGV